MRLTGRFTAGRIAHTPMARAQIAGAGCAPGPVPAGAGGAGAGRRERGRARPLSGRTGTGPASLSSAGTLRPPGRVTVHGRPSSKISQSSHERAGRGALHHPSEGRSEAAGMALRRRLSDAGAGPGAAASAGRAAVGGGSRAGARAPSALWRCIASGGTAASFRGSDQDVLVEEVGAPVTGRAGGEAEGGAGVGEDGALTYGAGVHVDAGDLGVTHVAVLVVGVSGQ